MNVPFYEGICQPWEAQVISSRGPQPITPPPPPPASSQPVVLTNPFPHQGYMVAQPTQSNVNPQPKQSGQNNYQILVMNYEEVNTKLVNLQTQSCQYEKPLTKSATNYQPKVSTELMSLSNGTL